MFVYLGFLRITGLSRYSISEFILLERRLGLIVRPWIREEQCGFHLGCENTPSTLYPSGAHSGEAWWFLLAVHVSSQSSGSRSRPPRYLVCDTAGRWKSKLVVTVFLFLERVLPELHERCLLGL